LLDLRRATAPFGDWLSSQTSMRWGGGIFRGEDGSSTVMFPKPSSDALIDIDRSRLFI
jgi:hypothetical protein